MYKKLADFVLHPHHVLPCKHPLQEYGVNRVDFVSDSGPSCFLQEAAVFNVPATFDQVVYQVRDDVVKDDCSDVCSTNATQQSSTSSACTAPPNDGHQAIQPGYRPKDVIGCGVFVFDKGMSAVWYQLTLCFPLKTNPRLHRSTLRAGPPGRVGDVVAVLARSSKPNGSPRTISQSQIIDNVLTNEDLIKADNCSGLVNIAQVYSLAVKGHLYWDISGTVDIGKKRVSFYNREPAAENGIAFVRGQFFDFTRQKKSCAQSTCASRCSSPATSICTVPSIDCSSSSIGGGNDNETVTIGKRDDDDDVLLV